MFVVAGLSTSCWARRKTMTETEWLAATHPNPMLRFLVHRGSDRKHRLFAVACCRRIWSLFTDERKQRAIETAERDADGTVTKEELRAAGRAVRIAGRSNPSWKETQLWSVASDVTTSQSWDASQRASWTTAFLVGNTDDQHRSEWQHHMLLLKCIFGPLPFRAVALSPDWLTSSVVTLASQMYESRDFTAMPLLADALQDAGCGNPDVLNHCRGPGPHVRGCWIVDLLLGKE